MRVIISGSRDCTDEKLIEEAILAGIEYFENKPKTFLHGDAKGVDKIAGKVVEKMGYNVEKYPAKWKDIKGKPESEIKKNSYGKYWVRAGLARNELMASKADGLIAISLGTSGTEHMINTAQSKKMKIYIYEPEQEECFGFNFWE